MDAHSGETSCAAGRSARQVVLASGNAGKLKELRELLSRTGCDVTALSEYTGGSADETGTTFVENAVLKARFACLHSGLPAIADDSGLIVACLGGQPGVRSARFAGEAATDEENRLKLLDDLVGQPRARRAATFVSVVVYMKGVADPLPVVCEGRWDGHILEAPQGGGGFGYDPIFEVAPGRSASDLTAAEKNQRSHRGKALRALLERAPWNGSS